MRAEAWSYLKNISVILGLLIYEEKHSTKKYLPKFVYDNLKDSMIVILIENRFLWQVQKIELINWDWLGINYAA